MNLPILFKIGAFGIVVNILAVVSALVYVGEPPHWLAWPFPPLLACYAIGGLQAATWAMSHIRAKPAGG